MTGYQSKRAAAQDKLDSMEREALKMALEALITITDAIYVNSQQEADAVYKANDAITAIKEALAQPAQEPVAWQFMNGSTFRKRRPEDFSDLAPDGFPYWKPLYTTLPIAQRPWVGLNDEEMQAVVDAQLLVSNINVYFKAIEAKLKERNA